MSYTQKPKMILFDVGGTLFNDGPCDPCEGFKKLITFADNPEAGDVQKMKACWDELVGEIAPCNRSVHGHTVDIPLITPLKYASMMCGLKYSISAYQQEELFDRYNSTRELTPGIVKLLQDLDEMGIRAAVISNNMMSGESLALAVKHWIPESKMEFCLTSADLQLCKPWGGLFVAAAAYAGVDPVDCWYCGDSLVPDVDGSRNGGMTPVLIDEKSAIPAQYRTEDGREPYFTVNHWDELGKLLRSL